MKHRRGSILMGEFRESFLMAMAALTAHKLRSGLTLLGVMIGVFSIIVVMTAIRVLQASIESELSQLGTHTFSISKWPAIHVGMGRDGWEKMIDEVSQHVGIENVGDGKDWPLTDAQVDADAALIHDLARRFHIEKVIGHQESNGLRGTPYFVELQKGYRNSKPDPGAAFLAKVRAKIADLGL